MRPNATQVEETPYIECGSLYQGNQSEQINGTCMVPYYEYYSYFCGMGGFTVPYQGWRFITPIFLHSGLIELAFTLVFQVWKGFQIEHDIGWWRMGIIYFLSGIFGVGWSANMTPNYGLFPPFLTAGQLGAHPFCFLAVSVAGTGPLFAILGLLYLDLFQNWPIILQPWKWFSILTVIILLLLGIGLLPIIDNFVHLGAFMMGILTGVVLVPHISFGKWDGRIKKIAMVVAIPIIALLFFAVFYTFYDSHNTNYCEYCGAFDCVPPNSAWCSTGGDLL